MNAIVATEKRSIIASMAERFGMDHVAFERTLRQTAMPSGIDVSQEQVAAFLLVASKYDLNPFTREIFAFPNKGGIQTIVSIDGWLKIINSHPQFDGMEFADTVEGDKLSAVTCKIYRKDRSHPVEVTEYMAECKGTSEPWKRWPARMLRHKAAIQAARYAFGFSGIMDPDEADRMVEATSVIATIVPVDIRTTDWIALFESLPVTATVEDCHARKAELLKSYGGADMIPKTVIAAYNAAFKRARGEAK